MSVVPSQFGHCTLLPVDMCNVKAEKQNEKLSLSDTVASFMGGDVRNYRLGNGETCLLGRNIILTD
jgi:hypothetical protein